MSQVCMYGSVVKSGIAGGRNGAAVSWADAPARSRRLAMIIWTPRVYLGVWVGFFSYRVLLEAESAD